MKNRKILAAGRTPCGIPVRLQQRGGKFDVISSSEGITWRYIVKGVSESVALATFNLRTLAATAKASGEVP